MKYDRASGVPAYESFEFLPKQREYCVLIPIINEGNRIIHELERAQAAQISDYADIVICDGGSTDGCTEHERLQQLGVNTLLVKQDSGKQGAQLRMGFSWALDRGYKGFITIDGNDKDSIEDVPAFIAKLEEGYDLVQGSRFVKGGHAENTPMARWLAVRFIHAPIISLTAGHWYTDTTNAYRAYSRRYLEHPDVQPLRDVFAGYELLAYLSVRANQLGLKGCEIPVSRIYPKGENVPTKISKWSGNADLFKILFNNLFRKYHVKGV